MVQTIRDRRIPRNAIANKRITAPQAGLVAVGGFPFFTRADMGGWTYTLPRNAMAYIVAIGAMCCGDQNAGGGAGGGGAAFKFVPFVPKGTIITTVASLNIGNVGGSLVAPTDATVSIPGYAFVGASSGLSNGALAGPGGIGYGGDINRRGGIGGPPNVNGTAGEGGGAGGIAVLVGGGGGGCASFGDLGWDLNLTNPPAWTKNNQGQSAPWPTAAIANAFNGSVGGTNSHNALGGVGGNNIGSARFNGPGFIAVHLFGI